MELLQKLVEGVQGNGEGGLESRSVHESEKEARVTKLTEKDDIEVYLTTFERLMETYEVPQPRWSFQAGTSAYWSSSTSICRADTQ